jgi:hypothetical protein
LPREKKKVPEEKNPGDFKILSKNFSWREFFWQRKIEKRKIEMT